MAVTFTSTRAILIIQATSLADEATSAGLTPLATALTELASEITGNSSITENEFFGGQAAAIVWANILDTAANVISAHNSNVARDIAVNNDSTQGIVSIAYSLGMIENSLSTISGHSNTIADKQTAMSATQTTIEGHHRAIKNLAEGNGIHTISPLDLLSFISTYRYLIEGGEILKDGPTLTEKELDKTNKRISDYISKINALPKAF